MADAIFQGEGGSWYHYDESYAEQYGPFRLRAEAERSLDRLCYHLDFGQPKTILVNASRWTGIDYPPASGRGIIRRWSFKSPSQLPIFMVWDEYWDDYEVEHAQVIFSTMDLRSGVFIKMVWRRLRWPLDRWFKRLIYDNSRCWRCGDSCAVYPSNPFKPGVCELHCEDHDFAYDRGVHQHACINCGMLTPYDYHD